MIPVQIMMSDAAARRMYLDTAINPFLNMPASLRRSSAISRRAFTLLKILGKRHGKRHRATRRAKREGLCAHGIMENDESAGELRRKPPDPSQTGLAATCPQNNA